MHPKYQNQRHEAEQVNIFPRTKSNTPIQSMPPENGPLPVYSILINVIASATEAELGGLFEDCHKLIFMRMFLSEMGHPQTPTPMEMDNTSANSIINGTSKQKRSRAIDMKFY